MTIGQGYTHQSGCVSRTEHPRPLSAPPGAMTVHICTGSYPPLSEHDHRSVNRLRVLTELDRRRSDSTRPLVTRPRRAAHRHRLPSWWEPAPDRTVLRRPLL